jgi:hypothetical protein
VFSFEITGGTDKTFVGSFERHIIDAVVSLNSDFRVAAAEHWESVRPEVRIFGMGEGPFAADSGRIKQTRLAP